MAWGDANGHYPHRPWGWWRVLARLRPYYGLSQIDAAYAAELCQRCIRSDHWWPVEAVSILNNPLILPSATWSYTPGIRGNFGDNLSVFGGADVAYMQVVERYDQPYYPRVVVVVQCSGSVVVRDWVTGDRYTSILAVPWFHQPNICGMVYHPYCDPFGDNWWTYTQGLGWTERGARGPSI